jgi:hypothetical protein
MSALAQDLVSARKAVDGVFDELALRTFVFTVEDKEGGWVLSVECATDEGWQVIMLPVKAAELRASLDDTGVPAVIYASEALMRKMDHKVYEQAVNVATLPGIVKASYAMPDAHWGYGFPIGGVAAFDPDEGGVVSAGACVSTSPAAYAACTPA